MADKATQYSPARHERTASGMHEGDLAPLYAGSVEQQLEQPRPVLVDREVQSNLEVPEAARLVALRADLVDHIADAVAARLLDHQALGQPVAEGAWVAHPATEQTTQPEALGDADATCRIQVLSSRDGYDGSAASAVKVDQSRPASKARIATPPLQSFDQVASQKADAPFDPVDPEHEGDMHAEEGLRKGSGAEQGMSPEPAAGEEGSDGAAGAWWEQWRGRLSKEQMQQAAQEVVAEELAQLLDTWDGAPGSLPSTLHGLAARRASPPPPSLSPPLPAQESWEALAASSDPAASAQQHDNRDATEMQGGQSSMRAGREGGEIARAVQQRVQELCLQQQQQAAAAAAVAEAQSDALLHAVLEALAEVSLEQLRARPPPSSPQHAASRHVPTCAGRRPRCSAGDAPLHHLAPMEDAVLQEELPQVLPPWEGAGLWGPERAHYEQSGSNPTKVTRAGRAKRSLERLKRRRQTAQRKHAAIDMQREAAVQAAHLASSLDASANPGMHPEQHPAGSSGRKAAEADVRRDGRALPPREGELKKKYSGERYVFGGSAGRSRPASPDLLEHHRCRAWSEDDDAADTHARHLRLLHRPLPPGRPQLHSSLPGNLRWAPTRAMTSTDDVANSSGLEKYFSFAQCHHRRPADIHSAVLS